MRRKRVKTLTEVRDFLKDGIGFFKREYKNAKITQNQTLMDYLDGRLKEAEWILSKID